MELVISLGFICKVKSYEISYIHNECIFYKLIIQNARDEIMYNTIW